MLEDDDPKPRRVVASDFNPRWRAPKRTPSTFSTFHRVTRSQTFNGLETRQRLLHLSQFLPPRWNLLSASLEFVSRFSGYGTAEEIIPPQVFYPGFPKRFTIRRCNDVNALQTLYRRKIQFIVHSQRHLPNQRHRLFLEFTTFNLAMLRLIVVVVGSGTWNRNYATRTCRWNVKKLESRKKEFRKKVDRVKIFFNVMIQIFLGFVPEEFFIKKQNSLQFGNLFHHWQNPFLAFSKIYVSVRVFSENLVSLIPGEPLNRFV